MPRAGTGFSLTGQGPSKGLPVQGSANHKTLTDRYWNLSAGYAISVPTPILGVTRLVDRPWGL